MCALVGVLIKFMKTVEVREDTLPKGLWDIKNISKHILGIQYPIRNCVRYFNFQENVVGDGLLRSYDTLVQSS